MRQSDAEGLAIIISYMELSDLKKIKLADDIACTLLTTGSVIADSFCKRRFVLTAIRATCDVSKNCKKECLAKKGLIS